MRPLTEIFSHGTLDHEIEAMELLSGEDISTRIKKKSIIIHTETSHRFILGLYELQHRFTTTFPHILLENGSAEGENFAQMSRKGLYD